MTSAQDIIARNSSQVMSSMDQNYAMYDGQQQKQQEGGQHAALQQSQHNALQQGQHASATFQQLQVQLQKQQQQLQRSVTDGSVPGSISGTLPLPLPVAAARAAGDVLYPALPQPSNMLAATQEALAERRAAVAAAVAAAPERAAAAAAAAQAAAAAAKKLPPELQNMGLTKPPGSPPPPPTDARTPPPTLASLAALHVEPPPPYVSNPSLAAYRNALMSQQPYSAHLASLMSGISGTFGNPMLHGATATGIPGITTGIPATNPVTGHTIPSLPMPTQLPGLAHLAQPQTTLQLPPLPSAALPSTGLLSAPLPSTGLLSSPQTTVAPAWQNTERENPICHSGNCHASQPMAMIPVAMPFPMHMHSCCPGPWMPNPPILWAMGSPACCPNNGATCSSAGVCCQMPSNQTPSIGIPNAIPAGLTSAYPRPTFPIPNSPVGGIVQTGPPGYRIPANLSTRNVATSTLNMQQQLPEKPKAF